MILPGDILWERFRVLRVESERFDRAWLEPLNPPASTEPGAPPYLLLSLERPASSALADLLTLLWHTHGGEPSNDFFKDFDILGEIEYRGTPGRGGVALFRPSARETLADALARSGPLPPGRVFEQLWILSGMLDQKFSNSAAPKDVDAAALCAVLVKLLNPRAMGLNASAKFLVVSSAHEKSGTELNPPYWTRFAAPEVLRGEKCAQSALVFSIAQLAVTMLFGGEAVRADTLASDTWARLALDVAGRRDASKEFLSDPRAASIPDDFRAVLAKCLKPKASARFASLNKLNAAFKKLSRAAWARLKEEPPASDTKILAAVKTQIPDGMILIEGGTFLSGEKKAPRTLRAFAIDATPVTECEYKEFLKEIKRAPREGGPGSRPAKFDSHPAVNVSWREAEEYAEHYGKRLPTVYEWEKAARGTDGRKYPYGDEFQAGTGKLRALALTGSQIKEFVKETAPVGTYPQGASPSGVLDMAGNVLEWTSTARRLGARMFKALKGSCFLDGSTELTRCASLQYKKPDTRENHIGFRCVKEFEEQMPDEPAAPF